VKKGIQLFVCSFIVAIYSLAWGAGTDVSYDVINSDTTTEKHKSYFVSDSNGFLTLTEPKEFNLQLTPTQITPVVKSLISGFSGLAPILSSVCEFTRLQYATFLRHFPIAFRAMELLYPSHYFL
jgi:hypothetical protein